MLATTSPGSPAPSKLLASPATELKFQIQGGEHHGRIVRIAGTKCTIGSAAGCTLRLRRHDIEPLHCLILAGRNGTVVRRNSPRTYLNGGAFDDALMQAGDVLSIGSLELVLVSCPQVIAVPTPPAKLPPSPVPAQTEVFTDQSRRELEELVASGRQQAQEQIQRLEQQLLEQQSESSRRVQELADLNGQLLAAREEVTLQRAASLEREGLLRSDLQQTRELVKEREGDLTAREAALQQQVAASNLEAASLRQELNTAQQSREQAHLESSSWRQEWELKLEEQRRELVRRQEECESSAEQLASLQNLLQETRQQFQQREAQQLADQQRAAEESAGVVTRLEADLAALTEKLHEREAEAAAATERGSESALALTIDLDNARRELHELRLKHSQVELARAGIQNRSEEQFVDLTARLMERDKAIAMRDQELAELRQVLAHSGAEEQMLRQLQENLAATQAAHLAERAAWRVEQREAESKHAELEAKLAALAAGHGELEAGRTELSAQRSSLEVERSQLAAQQGELSAQRSQLEADRGELHGQRSELESQRSELVARQSECESQRSEQESKLGNLDQQRRQLDAERGELETQRNLLAAERSSLESQTADLQAQLQSLQTQHNELEALASANQDAASRCAGLEAELAALRANPPQPQDPEAAAAAATEQTDQQHDEQVERWQSEAHKWQIQAEEVAGQLGDFKQSCARLKDEINELRAAGRQAPPEAPAEQPSAEITREELDRQRQEVDAARSQVQEEQARIGQLRADLSSREESLARFDADLRERQTVWEASRNEQASALEERTQLITMQIAQFEAEQAAYARQQATMIQQMSALEDRVQELTTAGEQQAAPEPSLAEAESVDRLAHEEVVESPDAAQEPPTLATPISSSPTRQQSPASEHQEDDSIEQYMSRLMNRVRGSAPSSSPAPVWRTEVAGPAPAIAPPPARENADQPKVYVPRAQAPELPGHLSQMRELANSAANSAIHTHAKRNQSRLTKHKSLIALLSLIGTVGLFVVGWNTGSPHALCGAAIFMLVCCVMCIRAILGGIQQLRLGQPKKIEAGGSAPTGPAATQESRHEPR